MSAALSNASQPSRGAFSGLLGLLASLGRAIRFPFDVILTGMVNAGLCVETLCEVLDLTRAGLYDHIVRLGLCSPSDKPARRRSARGWSKEDEQKALVWRAAGVHPEAIGANLDKRRSGNAVRAKLRRMGQAPPPRRELFRPEPAFFAAFSKGWFGPFEIATSSSPAANCGRAAGPATFRGAPPSSALDDGATAPAGVTSEPVVRPDQDSAVVSLDPAKRALGSAGKGSSQAHRVAAGSQREFGFFRVVGGSEHTDTAAAGHQVVDAADQPATECSLPVVKPIPETCEEVDFSDLSWIASVKCPLTHKPTVYAIGMLMMSGLHYRAAAKLTGKTEASYRTLRTRMDVPVDRDREKCRKIEQVFDLGVANATRDRGDWIVAKSLNTDDYRGPPHYFWKRKADRNTHLSPVLRKRDPMFARRSQEMTIITRQQLDAERRSGLSDKGEGPIVAGALGRGAVAAGAMAGRGHVAPPYRPHQTPAFANMPARIGA